MLVSGTALVLTLAGCHNGPASGAGPDGAPPGRAAELARINRAANATVAEARQQAEAGQLGAALATLEPVLAQQPDHVPAQLLAGDLHRWQKRYEQAEAAYERAANLEPANLDAQYRLGLARHLLGEYDGAVECYLLTLSINPEHFGANDNLAGVYLQLDRPAEAERYARAATGLKPDHQGSWANLAVAYSRTDQPAEAVTAYERALKLGPLSETDVLDWAEAYNKLGQHDRAIALLTPLLQRHRSAVGYARLGFAQFKREDYAAATDSYRTATARDPKLVPALNGLAVCLMMQYVKSEDKDPQARAEALSLWRRSLELQADQPKIEDLIEKFEREDTEGGP